jgi:hypothetical protein
MFFSMVWYGKTLLLLLLSLLGSTKVYVQKSNYIVNYSETLNGRGANGTRRTMQGMNTSFLSQQLLSFYIIPFLFFFASLFFYIV